MTVSKRREPRRKAVNSGSPCLNRLGTVPASAANQSGSWSLLPVRALTRCLPPHQGERRAKETEGRKKRSRDEEGRWRWWGEGRGRGGGGLQPSPSLTLTVRVMGRGDHTSLRQLICVLLSHPSPPVCPSRPSRPKLAAT